MYGVFDECLKTLSMCGRGYGHEVIQVCSFWRNVISSWQVSILNEMNLKKFKSTANELDNQVEASIHLVNKRHICQAACKYSHRYQYLYIMLQPCTRLWTKHHVGRKRCC